MHFLRRSLVGLFLLFATCGLVLLAGNMVWGALQARWSDEPQSRPARERVFAANVVHLVPETIRPTLSTFGEVRSRRSLELRAASAGEVIWLSEKFEEGGQVEKGDLLARIDPAEAQSALDTVRADVAEAEADLRDAERAVALAADDILAAENQLRLRENALTRQRDLLDRGVGSTAAVETAELAMSSANQSVLSRRQAEANAEARFDQTKTTLERRQIALGEAERRLSDTEVFAAFSGVLSGATLSEGRLVSQGERLAELIDPKALEVAFRVSTPQYTRLLTESGDLVGADVTASIDISGIDLEARGTISRESAAVGEGQTGRLLFARLDKAVGFRPGDFVAVRIEEPPLERVARLPATAVDAAGRVLLLGPDDRLEIGETEVLRREGEDVIVRARALADREVVAERTPLLGAGIKIRPIRPGNTDAPEEPETLALDPERRARLVAFVEANKFMPAEAKARVLAQLQEDRVPARVVGQLRSGTGFTAEPLARRGVLLEGTVTAIDNVIDRESRTLRVRGELDNAQDLLRDGMAFSISMSFAGSEYPAVPPLAVQWSSEGSFVWAVRDGRAERVPVTIRQRNAGSVLVEGDLADGTLVVVEGVQTLRPGAEVEVMSDLTATPDAAQMIRAKL